MITYLNKPVNISTPDTCKVRHENRLLNIPQSKLASECVRLPHGFIITAFAFEEFLTYNSLHYALHSLMQSSNTKDYSNLPAISGTAQSLLLSGVMPPGLKLAIIHAYKELGMNEPVVVSSHNFAVYSNGPQEDTRDEPGNAKTVSGEKNVLAAVQGCFVALYAGDAITYRQDNSFVHDKAALSVTVQKMRRLPRSIGLMGPGSFN